MTLCNLFKNSIFAFILLTGQLALASAENDWLLGTQAYEQKNIAAALQYFKSARKSGQTGPAVGYNIGICEYKLGQFSDARDTFATLGSEYPKMRPLAEYNIGLVELKLQNNATARQHFRMAYRLSGDNETLRILSSNKLGQTETTVAISPDWIGSVGIRAGYDDNIALRDDLGLPAGTTTDSPVIDVFASLQGPYSSKYPIQLDASAYVVRYLDNDDFDQSVLRLGAIYNWRGGEWNIQYGLHASHGTLSGDGFDDTISASIRANRHVSADALISLRYQYDGVNAADSIFAGIEGSRQRIDARYRWFVDDRSMTVAYQFESNDRDDPGVSPQRNRLIVDYRYRPGSGWGFEAGGEYRNSKFDDLQESRTENLTTIRAGLTRMLPAEWQMLAQYQYSENDSSDVTFSYQRNQIIIGILKVF